MNWNPRNYTMVSFLGFLFTLKNPRIVDEKACNPEMPTGTNKKNPYKSMLSLAKGQGKGQPRNLENF